MTIAHELVSKIARFSRNYNLQRFDPLIRRIHNPDKQQQRSIKKVVRLNNGTLFSLDTSSYLEWTLFFYGEYEPFTQKIIQTLLHPGSIAIDVGANIGIHSVTLARAVGSNGAVYSFEPHPTIFNKLVKNVSLNNLSWVHPIQAALDASSGSAILEGFDHQASNHGTSVLNADNQQGSLQKNQFHVTTMRLDDFIASKKITRLDLIKIDVEGHEEQVFQGAFETLKTLRPILIFEDSKKNIISNGSSIKSLLQELSYTLYTIHYNHLTELEHHEAQGYNFLAIPLKF